MGLIYLIIIGILLYCGMTRCIIFNLHNVGYYGVKDIYEYFKHKKWRLFNYYGIDMFVGMFGHGKTLSMTHKVRMLYKKYGNSVRIISNYKLIGIPYTPLINFNQLVELGEEQPLYIESKDQIPPWYYNSRGKVKKEYLEKIEIDGKEVIKVRNVEYQGTIVLIDEIEDVLSHRNYASFPLQLLSTLTQQRKKHVYIMCSAQRFFMVDKLFRAITTNVIDCSKYWRLQHMAYYDAWDYENAMNVQLVKRLSNHWWFVKNRDFDCYDTEQMISKNMAEDFISNEESIVRKGLDSTVNELAIAKPSRRLRKARKKGK